LERPSNRSDRPGKMQENQWPRNPVLTLWQSERICSDNATGTSAAQSCLSMGTVPASWTARDSRSSSQSRSQHIQSMSRDRPAGFQMSRLRELHFPLWDRGRDRACRRHSCGLSKGHRHLAGQYGRFAFADCQARVQTLQTSTNKLRTAPLVRP
jgi:hypothetical protein